MPVKWAAEACDRYYDPASGALVIQMTTSPLANINIYCEQPYASPDGKRIAILRYRDISFDESGSLLVGDLDRLKIALVERDVAGVFNAAWSGILHYHTKDQRLFRVSLQTLERQEIGLSADADLFRRGGSVSPDQRYVAVSQARPDTMTLGVLDLQTGKHQVIYEHPEMVNPHMQFNPVDGKDILVQLNRGSTRNAEGTVESLGGEEGTTHFLIARDGSGQRALSVGPPYTATSTGHSNFIADTGRVIVATQWNHGDWSLDSRTPEGNIVTVAPGESKPQVFKAPEHRFNHVNASRCGRYFVSDSQPGGMYGDDGRLNPWCLVVGNIETGKYRVLVSDTAALGGGAAHTHPHAYITADNRHVIYNGASQHGASQVCAAAVPDEFLKSLD